MSFFNLSHRLIHPSIKEDEVLFSKAKTLLLLLLFFLIVVLSYTTFFVFNGVFFNAKAMLNYFGLAIISTCLLMLKNSTNVKHPLRLVSYSGAFLITGGVYWSGGFASNDILWYVVASVSSLLFIGKSDGIAMTIISIAAIICFYIIEIGDFVELPFDPLTRSIHYRFANAFAIILILFFLFWVLLRSNDRLHKIIQNIQNSQVRESISQDFHDELGNKLASVVHLSKRLKSSSNPKEQEEMLTSIERESQEVYDNFRDFIWTNDPSSLNVSSLFMYLTDFNQQFFAHKDMQVEGELLPSGSPGDEQISSHIVRHIVPMFKEVMTNSYKHANADRIDWSFTITNDLLILRIKDNGIGFNTDTVQQGHGFKGINKRTEQLNASLTLTSTPGKGTETTISIAMTNKKHPHA